MQSLRSIDAGLFVFVGVLFVLQCCTEATVSGGRGGSRRRNRGGNLNPELHQAYMTAYGEGPTPPPLDPSFRQLVPESPGPNEIECHFEVITIQMRHGKCVQLGGMSMPFACQSGEHLALKPECEQIMAARSKK